MKHSSIRLLPFNFLFFTVLMVFLIPFDSLAQSAAGAQSIVKKFIDVINILFPAALVFGLIYTVIGYIADSPNKHQRLLYLIIGVAVWYGFSMIIGDIQSSFGGSGKIDSNIAR
jgi:hypothetical protein